MVEVGMPDSTKQNRLRRLCRSECLIRKGRLACANRRAADPCFDEVEAVAELFTDSRENGDRRGCDFGPDAVAGQHGYARIHTPKPYPAASFDASRPAGTAARPQTSVVIASKSSSDTCFCASARVTMRR